MIIVLDPPGGAQPPYVDWLAGEDLVLVTGRPAGDVDTEGYAEVRCVPDYASSATVELAVLELAATAEVSALVATATPDLVRAGALRAHLGIPGPGRAAATVFADPVATRQSLLAAGVPVVPAGPVLRVADLYWYRHRWGGGALRVRRRRAPGWPTAAILRDDADLRAFTAAGLAPSLVSVPSLLVEPYHDGDESTVSTVDDSLARDALAALPTTPGDNYRVNVRHTATGDRLVDTVESAGGRDAVLAQAGLSRDEEVTRWAS